jgi:hypothetical protein
MGFFQKCRWHAVLFLCIVGFHYTKTVWVALWYNAGTSITRYRKSCTIGAMGTVEGTGFGKQRVCPRHIDCEIKIHTTRDDTACPTQCKLPTHRP